MFMANASLSNFFSCFASIEPSVMAQTLTFHFAFVTARDHLRVNAMAVNYCTATNILILSYSSPNGALCCLGIKRFGRQWLPPKRGTSENGMSVGRQKRMLVAGALVACTLALAACSTSIADLPIVGTPA